MEGKFVSVKESRAYYVERGAGQPLLYVHGNTGSSRWFERVMDVSGFRTIAPDMPNFGRSGPLSGEPDMDRYADFVIDFIETLHLQNPILIGHSLGGAVGISLVARRPQIVRALVLVDSSSPSGLVTPEDRHPLIETMRTNRDFLSQALFATVPTLTDRVFFNALVDDATHMAAPAWIGNARALSNFNYTGRCSVFANPVLVLWGRKDVIITEAMARETAEAFPRGRLEIMETVGHSPMVEDPAGFVRILSEFVSRLGKEPT